MAIRLESELGQQMLESVRATSPERATELVNILENYDGDPTYMKEWCQNFGQGTMNPWMACAHAKQMHISRRSRKERQGADQALGISSRGQYFQRLMFTYSDTVNPRVNQMEIGFQGMVKIIQAFGSPEQIERYAQAPSSEQYERKRTRVLEEDAEIQLPELEELLADPERIREVRSLNVRENLRLLEQIRNEIRDGRVALDTIALGDEIGQPVYRTHRMALAAGSVERYCRNNYDELPENVQTIYDNLFAPSSDLSDIQRKALWAILRSHAEDHLPADRDGAIGEHIRDIDFVRGLDDDHAIVQKYGQMDLVGIQQLLKQDTLTPREAQKVYEAYDFERMRREVNGEALGSNRVEFDLVMDRIRPLFVSEGKWRGDAYQSVPNRIRESVYFACLTRDDIDDVKTVLGQYIGAKENADEMCTAVSLEGFEEEMDSIVNAARKIDYMEKLLREADVTVDDVEDAAGLVEQWRSKCYRGRDWQNFENYKTPESHDMDELLARIKVSGAHTESWRKHGAEIEKARMHGLYSVKMMEKVADAVKMADALVKVEERQVDLDKVPGILANRLIRRPTEVNFGDTYLTPRQMSFLDDIMTVGERVEAMEDTDDVWEKAEALQQKFRERDGFYYTGGFMEETGFVGGEGLTLDVKALSDIPYEMVGAVNFYDAAKLKHLVEGFKEPKDVDRLKDKIRFISSLDRDMLAAEDITIYVTNRMKFERLGWNKSYLHQDLIGCIDRVYAKIEEAMPRMNARFEYDADLVQSGHDALDEAQLDDTLHVSISGTKPETARRFKDNFKEYKVHFDRGRWRADLFKSEVGALLKTTDLYNRVHQDSLRIEVE